MSNTINFSKRIIWIFIDGIGLGSEKNDANPFSHLSLPHFNALSNQQPWVLSSSSVLQDNNCFIGIDANLDVEGLPQSGTGQAALFTGTNCAQIAGRHYGPFPHSTSKPVIAKSNIFKQIEALLLPGSNPSAFANAYPPIFFKQAEARNRWTVTTLSCLEANLPVRTQDDLLAGNAITAEITGKAWRERLNLNTPVLTEEEAGKQLAQISKNHAFTLYEYYLTDKAGHAQDPEFAGNILHSLDRFLKGILTHTSTEDTLLIITSDHGNLEDLTTKSHTRNPVPFIAYGPGASFFHIISSIQDVTPTIIETLASFYSIPK